MEFLKPHKLELYLNHSSLKGWHREERKGKTVFVKGQVWWLDKLYGGKDLCTLVLDVSITFQTEDDWGGFFYKLNGNFSIIYVSETEWVAVVDRIRSIPLFYAEYFGKIYLSDNAIWVKEIANLNIVDQCGLDELLLSRFTSGNQGIFQGLYQVHAGEMIGCTQKDGQSRIWKHRYFRFLHNLDQPTTTYEEFANQFNRVLTDVFQRFIEASDGRTIVVPLSGGYDSRLIACMLKKLGKKEVVCYTYGHKYSWEVEVSRKTAQKLNMPWYFINYTRSKWREWYNSPEREEFFRFSSDFMSIPHIQDWPAIWELKKQGIISESSVVMPGHSGDFIAGSHIPVSFLNATLITPDKFLKSVFNKHYFLWYWSKRKDLVECLGDRIINQVEGLPLQNPEMATNAFEYFDWQNRQAKFIVNSVQVYEFWGTDWLLPLWDNLMIDFWSNVPLEFRIGKGFYNRFLCENTFLEFGVIFKEDTSKFIQGYAHDLMERLFNPYAGIYSPTERLRFGRMYHEHFGSGFTAYKNTLLYSLLVTSAWLEKQGININKR